MKTLLLITLGVFAFGSTVRPSPFVAVSNDCPTNGVCCPICDLVGWHTGNTKVIDGVMLFEFQDGRHTWWTKQQP